MMQIEKLIQEGKLARYVKKELKQITIKITKMIAGKSN